MKFNRFLPFFILLSLFFQLQLIGCNSAVLDTNSSSAPPASRGPGGSDATPPPAQGVPMFPVKLCENGEIDSGEWCDGDKMLPNLFGNPMTCSDAILYKTGKIIPSTGTVQCSSDCNLDISQCHSTSLCGNGKLDPGEECDAVNPVTHQSQSPYCTNDCQIECSWGGFIGVPKRFEGNGLENAGDGGAHCYFDIRSNKNYGAAEDVCKSLGGHLLILNSDKEYHEIISDVIKYNPNTNRWIGLRRGSSHNPDYEATDWWENFYWTSFDWGIRERISIAPDLAWKGRKGRAPEALPKPDYFLQYLWKSDEPNDCGGIGCIYAEESVEMLGADFQYQLNDSQSSSENYFLCEIEPPVLYAK